MKRFDKQIFVCENLRDEDHPRGSCARKNSGEFREMLKKRLKELGLNSFVRANKSGCLDACEFGPVMVVYPGQYWYSGLKPENIEEFIQEHILNDRPLERFLIKDKRFNRDLNGAEKENN